MSEHDDPTRLIENAISTVYLSPPIVWNTQKLDFAPRNNLRPTGDSAILILSIEDHPRKRTLSPEQISKCFIKDLKMLQQS